MAVTPDLKAVYARAAVKTDIKTTPISRLWR
jgi:hypothetical protein